MSDLCLYITTHNRPRELRRLLEFLAQGETPWPLAVIDTSAPAAREENRAAFRAHPGLAVRHLAYAPETTHADAVARALQEFPHDLVAFCHDDDLIVPAFVQRAAEFLRAHPDYAICCGRFCFTALNPLWAECRIQSNFSIEDEAPLARFQRMLEALWPCFFGVHRLDAARLMMASAQAFPLKHDFQEIIFTAMPLLAGKLRVLDEIGYVHVIHGDNLSTRQYRERGASLRPGEAQRSLGLLLDFLERELRARGGPAPLDAPARARATAGVFAYFSGYYWILEQAVRQSLKDYWALPAHRVRPVFRQLFCDAFLGGHQPPSGGPSYREYFQARYQFCLEVGEGCVPRRSALVAGAWQPLDPAPLYRPLCALLLSEDFPASYTAFARQFERALKLEPGVADVLLTDLLVDAFAGQHAHHVEPAADIVVRLGLLEPAGANTQFLQTLTRFLQAHEPPVPAAAAPRPWYAAWWRKVRRAGVDGIKFARREAFRRRVRRLHRGGWRLTVDGRAIALRAPAEEPATKAWHGLAAWARAWWRRWQPEKILLPSDNLQLSRDEFHRACDLVEYYLAEGRHLREYCRQRGRDPGTFDRANVWDGVWLTGLLALVAPPKYNNLNRLRLIGWHFSAYRLFDLAFVNEAPPPSEFLQKFFSFQIAELPENVDDIILQAVKPEEKLRPLLPRLDRLRALAGRHVHGQPGRLGEVAIRHRGCWVNGDSLRYWSLCTVLLRAGIFRYLERVMAEQEFCRVMEIGAGFGGLAYQLKKTYGDRLQFVAVDLIESLIFSSIYLTTTGVGPLLKYRGEKAVGPEHGVVLVPSFRSPEFFAACGPVDLCVNTISMNEMSSAQVSYYGAQLARVLRADGVFYEANWPADVAGVGRIDCKTLLAQHFGQRLSLRDTEASNDGPIDLWGQALPAEVREASAHHYGASLAVTRTPAVITTEA